MTRQSAGGDALIVDDAFDDAAAAYREVAERAPVDQAAPVERDVEPADSETSARTDERPRDPGGRFARKTKDEPTKGDELPEPKGSADEGKQPNKKDGAEKAESEEPATQHVAGAPPPSWSIKSKAGWDQLPEHFRADIVKREQEMAQGLSALRDYKDLKPFAEMAQKHGTTIAKALEEYTAIDGIITRNLPQGLALLAERKGMNKDQAAQLFAQMAETLSGGRIKVGGATPGQQQQQPQQPADPVADLIKPHVSPLLEQIQELKGQLTAQQQAQQQRASHEAARVLSEKITALTSDPKFRFHKELEPTMTSLIEKGLVKVTGDPVVDFTAAYELAAGMHPEVREALIEQRLEEERVALRKKEQEAAEKAKAASRSMSGSRVPGTVIKDAEPHGGQDDLEAEVRKAWRQHTYS